MWFGARGSARKPVRRAARFDGLVPIDVDEAGLQEMLHIVCEQRGSLDGFDVVVRPNGPAQYDAFAQLGATWATYEPRPGDHEVVTAAANPPGDVF